MMATKGELKSEAAIWAEDTPYHAAELVAEYDDYCTLAREDGRDPLDFAQWAEEIKGIDPAE